ncbi:MAG: VOC family protein [Phycisphaerae bacterium]
MLRRIDRLLFRVPNLPSAVRYWCDTFKLVLVRQEAHFATLKLPDDDTEILLHTDPDLPDEGVYFLVDDVRQMHARRDELKLTFLSRPVQATRGWRATVKDPFGRVLLLLDRTSDNPTPETAQAAGGGLFPGVEVRHAPRREALVRAYEAVNRTADDLPYTPHFEQLFEAYAAAFDEPRPDRAEVWRHLLNVRKAGALPKLGDARSPAPDVSPEEKEALRDILGVDIGRRDRLPYTPRFEEIALAFAARRTGTVRGRRMPPHALWRLIASLSK